MTSDEAAAAELEPGARGRTPESAAGSRGREHAGFHAPSSSMPLGGAVRWVQAQLGSRRGYAWAMALSLITALPALWVRFDSDDRFQVASLEQNPDIAGIARAPWDLYSFAKDRASNIALREEGVFPWWTDTGALISFFRPLASWSRWLDQTLWPQHVPLMQLHSLAWFAFLLWSAAQLYRRFSPAPWVGGLAFVLFAFDEARAATIAWLCHRNTLISLAFGFSALAAHARWRAQARDEAGPSSHAARARTSMLDRGAAWWGPVAFAFALLGGETALQVCGYLIAYALFLDQGSRRERFGALLPYLGVLAVWAVAYKLLGHGAEGSAFYTDPLRHPLAFARLLPGRLSVYALAQFEGISAEWFNLLPVFGVDPNYVLWPLAIGCAAALIAALTPLYRRDPLVRFWAVGSLLAAVPACGVAPTDRMLTGAGLGAMALLAALLSALVEKTYPALRPVPRRSLMAFGMMLAVVNLGIAPVLRPFLIGMMDGFDAKVARADANISRAPEVEHETFVLLNPPFDTFAIFFSLYRETEGIPRPERVRWLATGVSDLRVERVDARTLKLAPADGYLSTPSQQVLRSLDRPLRVGEQVALSDVTFEVLSLTEDGRPKEVLARFTQPLEAAKYRWLQWGKHEYVPFRPPAIGQAITIPAVDLRLLLSEPT